VALLTASATLLVHALVTEPLTRLARASAAAAAGRDPGALVLPLDELVLAGAALALAVCWLWLLLGVVSAALDIRLGPRWVRTLTAVALGVTALHGPAGAEPSGERAVPSASAGVLAGLPLPDRAVAIAARAPAAARTGPVASTVRVRAGDSLWSIAAAMLPPETSPNDVSAAWQRIAAANTDVLGPDPDLIFPGTTLQVPPLDQLLGEETP
jgi:nucleoid-associated protein YgaU